MLSIVSLVGLGPFTVTYLANLCAVATVGGVYLAAMWISRRAAMPDSMWNDLQDNADVDRRNRERADCAGDSGGGRGGFTPPTAPATPTVAHFDGADPDVDVDAQPDLDTLTRDGVTVARCHDEAVATTITSLGPVAISLRCTATGPEKLVVADMLCSAVEGLRATIERRCSTEVA